MVQTAEAVKEAKNLNNGRVNQQDIEHNNQRKEWQYKDYKLQTQRDQRYQEKN